MRTFRKFFVCESSGCNCDVAKDSSLLECYTTVAINISYSECVSVALVILLVVRMRPIVMYGQSGITIFFSRYLINSAIFRKLY